MLDTDFDDFLDSDDDALFVEAANSITDHVSPLSGATNLLKENIPQNEPKTVPFESSPKLCDSALQSKKESHIITKKPTQESVTYHSKLQDTPPFHVKSTTLNSSLLVPAVNAIENETASSLLAKTSEPLCNKSSVAVERSYINSRFIPGFTPKAKKRKLPGPAGLLELYNESEETEQCDSLGKQVVDVEFENIMSSQFTIEHLSLSSWQKLQTAVSSCSSLHSRAKYYSIKRVLKESSKKKLPKHMIVPVLCVLLKKTTYNKGSAVVSVFMDDTGEINGKIDVDVLSAYKEYIVEGSAFILKKVTFLCNMLLLKAENLVSIYHPDGSEKHPQTLESILETPEPSKPMQCECSKLDYHSGKNNMNGIPKGHISHKLDCVSQISKKLKNISNHETVVNNNITNLSPSLNAAAKKSHGLVQNMRSDAFLENLLDDGNCVDEFDELLGNLDEKSFMEDM